MKSAKRLNLDTTLSDVQAEAILQSLFGISLTESAARNRTRLAVGLSAAQFPDSTSDAPETNFEPRDANRDECTNRYCEVIIDVLDCVGGVVGRFGTRNEPSVSETNACAGDQSEFQANIIESFEILTEQAAAWLTIVRHAGGRLTRKLIRRSAIQQLSTSNSMLKPASDAAKTFRKLNALKSDIDEGLRDLVRDTSGGLRLTKRGLRKSFENIRAIGQRVVDDNPDRIRRAQNDFAG